jgi:hypothetical protein
VSLDHVIPYLDAADTMRRAGYADGTVLKDWARG